MRVRSIRRSERPAVEAFLREGGTADLWMAHCLEQGGLNGFVTATDDGSLVGVAIARSGAVCAAARTSDAAADALGRALASRIRWRSVVGPERPCSRLVRWLALTGEPRVDREQVLMAAGDTSLLAPPHPGLRRAVRADTAAITPLVRRYRLEDGLSFPGDDDSEWVTTYARRRIENELLYVVEDGGRIVWTGAFNFVGAAGAGLGGIFTVPDLRGRGVGTAATAALCRLALTRARHVTLHVNRENAAARRCYARAGLVEAGPFRLTFR